MRLYVESAGQTQGPLSPEELVLKIQDAVVQQDSEVWLEGATRTVPVHRLLNGRAAEAELVGVLLALREELEPPAAAAPPPRPQVFSPGEVLVLLPGFALAAAVLIGGIAALLWFGLDLFRSFLFPGGR